MLGSWQCFLTTFTSCTNVQFQNVSLLLHHSVKIYFVHSAAIFRMTMIRKIAYFFIVIRCIYMYHTWFQFYAKKSITCTTPSQQLTFHALQHLALSEFKKIYIYIYQKQIISFNWGIGEGCGARFRGSDGSGMEHVLQIWVWQGIACEGACFGKKRVYWDGCVYHGAVHTLALLHSKQPSRNI